MKVSVQNETFGVLTLDESFWTGKKNLSVNGVALQKSGKNVFEYEQDGQKYTVILKGNFLTGATLWIGDQTIRMTEKPAWYEIASSVFIFVFILVWGNVPPLIDVLPLVGGAIGGLVSAVCAFVNLFLMKSTKNVLLKLLIFVLCFGVTILLCWLIALAFLTAA